jgi:hypothetical protein
MNVELEGSMPLSGGEGGSHQSCASGALDLCYERVQNSYWLV